MSLTGLHYSYAARHDRYGQYLQNCAEAGSPVPLVFSVMQDVAADVRRYSPQTVTAFRYQSGDQDDATLGQGEAVAAAVRWMNQAAAVFDRNPGHTFYCATNELNPSTPDHHRWAATYYLAQMVRADELGIKVVWGNPSTGCIDYPEWPAYYGACVQYAVEHGHPLGLHCYGLDYGAMRSAPADLVLRYRRVYKIFQDNGWGWPKLIISECGPGSHVNGSGDVADVEWYDAQLMADRSRGIPIIGAAFYQWGGDEASLFARFAPGFFEHIRTHPTVDAPPTDETVKFAGRILSSKQAALAQWVSDNGGKVVFGEAIDT